MKYDLSVFTEFEGIDSEKKFTTVRLMDYIIIAGDLRFTIKKNDDEDK